MTCQAHPSDAIATAILLYLERHPAAADTAEGITKWWLPEGSHADLAEVERSLHKLLAQGCISRQTNADQHVMYMGSSVHKDGRKVS